MVVNKRRQSLSNDRRLRQLSIVGGVVHRCRLRAVQLLDLVASSLHQEYLCAAFEFLGARPRPSRPSTVRSDCRVPHYLALLTRASSLAGGESLNLLPDVAIGEG